MQKSESKILYDQIIKLLKTTRNIGETVEKERAEYTALREKYGKLYLEKHDEMMEEGSGFLSLACFQIRLLVCAQ